jgi:hypothetical protein
LQSRPDFRLVGCDGFVGSDRTLGKDLQVFDQLWECCSLQTHEGAPLFGRKSLQDIV